jgi:K+-transporting ATPase ATPase C chain
MSMKSILRPALVLLALFSVLTGILYPAAVTALAQGLFPHAANGSLIVRDGRVVGSSLIGQAFTDPKYFWSRPSATAPFAYNAASSSGSNLGPTNPALREQVAARVLALRASDPGNAAKVPVDLVTTSASGLDPHVSLAAARWQLARVARVRGFSTAVVERLVEANSSWAFLGALGEARVNVLELNLALDQVASTGKTEAR